jgi:hypothetical protein
VAVTEPDWPTFPNGPRAQRLHSMVLTRHFVLLHVPRTGGQFLRKICFEQLPADWFIRNALDAHTPYEVIADDFADLPMFALVRNPWDWYVSIYHYLTQTLSPEDRGPMWDTAYERGRGDFKSVVTRLCTPEGFENPTTKPIMERLDCDHGTAVWWRIAGEGVGAGRVELGRFESLQQDFQSFLERHDVPVGKSFTAALASEPPFGASRRDTYARYYDDELRQLVGRRARRIVDAYGYEFEQ